MRPEIGHILLPGERTLWQGKPSGGVHLRWPDWFMLIFGLVFTAIAASWILATWQTGAFTWKIGLLHVTAGILLVLTPLVAYPWLRRRTFYTLTDSRALIQRRLPLRGNSVDIYPIDRMSELGLQPGNPGTVWFASRHSWSNTQPIKRIGFEFIPDADHVFGLISRRQKEQP